MKRIRLKNNTIFVVLAMALFVFLFQEAIAKDLSADFKCDVRDRNAPLNVQFKDMSIGQAVNRIWDFGDCGTANEVNPIYRYNYAGTYTVTLNIISPGGSDTAMKTDYIKVSSAPPPPKAAGQEPPSGT